MKPQRRTSKDQRSETLLRAMCADAPKAPPNADKAPPDKEEELRDTCYWLWIRNGPKVSAQALIESVGMKLGRRLANLKCP